MQRESDILITILLSEQTRLDRVTSRHQMTIIKAEANSFSFGH